MTALLHVLALPGAVYVTQTVGLALSLALLSGLGGLARRSLLPVAEGSKPWAFDIVLGMVVAAAYFVVRSLLAKMLPWMPGAVEQEPALLALAGAALFRRPLLATLWAEARVPLSRWSAAALFGSMLLYGHWHLYSLLPVSSDPAMISILVDAARSQGVIPHVLPGGAPSLLGYPMGIEALAWTLANPALTSVSLVQSWPSIATSLLAFVVFEGLTFAVALSPRAHLTLLTSTLAVRLLLGAFEISPIWMYVEGMSKRTLGFLVAFAAVAMMEARRSHGPSACSPSRSGAWTALAAVALVFPALVNPINAFVSAAGLLGLAIALVAIHGRPCLPRTLAVAAPLLALMTGAALLQEPMIVRKSAIPCAVLSIPWCGLDAAGREQAENGVGKVTITGAHEQPWRAYLPAVATHWSAPFDPRSVGAFPSRAAAVASALLCVPLALWLARRRRSALLPAGVAAVVWLLALPLLIRAQVWAIHSFGEKQIRHMLMTYTDLAFLNLWQPAYYAVVLGSLLIAVRWIETGARPARAGVAVLALVLAGGGALNYKRITELRQHPDFGRSTADLARLFLDLRARLESSDTILLPAMHYQGVVGVEEWLMPGTEVALQLYLPNPFLQSYSSAGFWPPMDRTLAQHVERVCSGDCAYLASLDVDALVAVRGGSGLCGVMPDVFAPKSGCFLPGEAVQAGDAAAVIYRRMPASSR